MPSESTKWAALLLKRRLDSAASQEERQSILRDIERSRKDPVYRQKLGDIAQWGRFSSGPHLGAQMALGALTAAGFVPGLQPLGILGGAGLSAYGAVNIGEAIQRREEDLPWKAQTGFGAADILLGPVGRTLRPVGRGASGILRGLRVAKQPAEVGARLIRRLGYKVIPGVGDDPPFRKQITEHLKGKFRPGQTGIELREVLDPEAQDMLRALREIPTPGLTSFPQPGKYVPKKGPPKFEPGASVRIGRGDPIRITDKWEGLPREVGTYDPTTGTWSGGEGLSALPKAMRKALIDQRVESAGLVGGKLVPRSTPRPGSFGIENLLSRLKPIRVGEVRDEITGKIAGTSVPAINPKAVVRYSPLTKRAGEPWTRARPTAHRSRLHKAKAENAAADAIGQDRPWNIDQLDELQTKATLEEATEKVLEGQSRAVRPLPPSPAPLVQRLRVPRPVPRPVVPPAAPKIPPTPAVETVAPPPALPTKVVSDIGEGPFDTAVTQIMSSLGQTGAHLVPAMMWWRQVFREAGEKVTRETLSDIMFAKSLAVPEAARFFANPLAHRPTGGVQKYTALKRGLLRELPATRKTELGRRPSGTGKLRIAEEAKIENVKKKAEEYYPTLTRPEQDEALKELRTSNSLKNPRARLKLEVEGKWRTPRKTDPEYVDYKLTLSSIALKNRFQSVLKILKEQGVLAPESEARLQNLIHEAYLRAQHGFPSSGARFTDKSGRNFLVGRVGGTGKYRAHDEIKNLDEIDLDALSASERKALDAQLRPMEAIPEFINYLGPILKSLGVLFAGIFTAEQLMPERGLNAAAG